MKWNVARYKISKSYVAIRKRYNCKVIKLAFFSSLSVFANEVNMSSISSILSHGSVWGLYCYGLGRWWSEMYFQSFWLVGSIFLLWFLSAFYLIEFFLFIFWPCSLTTLTPIQKYTFYPFSLFLVPPFLLASSISPETIYLSCILPFLMNIPLYIPIFIN